METLKEVVVRLEAHHGVNEAQQSHLYNGTVKSLDLALPINPQVTKEVERSPVQQKPPSQPPELLTEVVAQSPLYPEVTDPAQSRTMLSIQHQPVSGAVVLTQGDCAHR